jgi:hypothetical protein
MGVDYSDGPKAERAVILADDTEKRMTIVEYIDTVKGHLLINPLIQHFQIIRERTASADGHLRVKLTLSNRFVMEFSEYIQLDANGHVAVVTYSYNCSDRSGKTVVRWDNTPHFPDLPGFPHHKHIGSDEAAEAGYPVDIFSVLDEIQKYM